MADYSWEPSTDGPTDYQLDKSVDGGLTWTPLATIPHVAPGPDYNTETGRFEYTDASPVAGEIVRIQAVDSGDPDRDSSFIFKHGPAATPVTIHIYGQVVDGVTGVPRGEVEVRVSLIPEESSVFLPTEGGAAPSSNLGRPLLGHRYPARIYTDAGGNWTLDTLRDLPLHVEIPETGYMMRFRTPKDRDLLNIVDAGQYATGDGVGSRTPYEYGASSGFVT